MNIKISFDDYGRINSIDTKNRNVIYNMFRLMRLYSEYDNNGEEEDRSIKFVDRGIIDIFKQYDLSEDFIELYGKPEYNIWCIRLDYLKVQECSTLLNVFISNMEDWLPITEI